MKRVSAYTQTLTARHSSVKASSHNGGRSALTQLPTDELYSTGYAVPKKYNAIGNSGLVVSAVGLGCNNLGRAGSLTEEFAGSERVVRAALDAGITLFDTADSYGKTPGLSEEYLGKSLAGQRDQVVIATKFGMPMNKPGKPDFGARGSRGYIIRAVEDSLRRLGTDWIDLYQFHTPDPLTPIDETLSALSDLVHSGKVRYIGHSNRTGWQIAEAAHVAQEANLIPFISAQNHYNLLDRRAELEVIPAAGHYGLGVIPYFPLAAGLLTGKYTTGIAPAGSRLAVNDKRDMLGGADLRQLAAFGALAAKSGVSPVQAAIGWLISRPAVSSVIAGATRVEQVEENAQAADWIPSEEDLIRLDELFPPEPPAALF